MLNVEVRVANRTKGLCKPTKVDKPCPSPVLKNYRDIHNSGIFWISFEGTSSKEGERHDHSLRDGHDNTNRSVSARTFGI